MMWAMEANVRRDLGRGSEIERTANRLGPIYYELRKAREERRRERIERFRAALVTRFDAVRALLLPTTRARCQAECAGAH